VPAPAAVTPSVVDVTPSIPLAPRFASTRGGSERGAANHSRSRTGIDDDVTTVDEGGDQA